MAGNTSPTLPRWRRLRRWFYFRLLVSVLWFVEHLPLDWARGLGRCLGRLGSLFRRREKEQARANLRRVFPDWGQRERESLLRQSTDLLGENLVDSLLAPQLLQEPGMVAVESGSGDLELMNLLRELSAPGRGVLILSGHLGCWELLGAWLAGRMKAAALGPLAVVTGSIHNPAVDRLVQDRRQSLGLKILPRTQGAGPLLRHLRQGGIAAVLLDQNTRVENLAVPFFGWEAPTPTVFARLALRLGAPILPLALARQGRGHRVFRAPAWIPSGPSNDDPENLRQLLLWCNGNLESFIRRNPAQWVWFHQRWSEGVDQHEAGQC